MIRQNIKWYISKGYSANRIQKVLQNRKMGIRRKVLLSEIRAIKRILIKPEPMKYAPKKYRYKTEMVTAQAQIIKGGMKQVYRMSFVINGVPCSGTLPHANLRAQTKRYLGFLLQVFHENSEFLRLHTRDFKMLLLNKVEQYLGYGKSDFWFDWYIATEYPTQIIDTLGTLNGTWLFQVEKDGAIIYSDTGRI